MGFKERDGKVKASVIPNIKYKTLKNRIDVGVARDSTICTDELRGYNNLQNYTHQRVCKEYGFFNKWNREFLGFA